MSGPCWASSCQDDGTDRYIATNGSLAGSQLKVSAKRCVFCDEHWALVQHNLAAR